MRKGKERILVNRGDLTGKKGKGRGVSFLVAMFLCCLLLALVWILCARDNRVKAAEQETALIYTSGAYQYKLLGDGTVEITGYIGTGGEITIPAHLDGRNVSKIGDFAFMDNVNITKVIIEDGIKELGRACFYDCEELVSIYIPDSVESMDILIFADARKLVEVRLSKELSSIPEGTFDWCTSLEKVEIPNKVKMLGYSAFGNCTGLMEIYLPDSVTLISEYAFGGCKRLEKIRISPKTKIIGEAAFDNDERLKWITSVDYKTLSIKDYTSVASVLSEEPWIQIEERAFYNSLQYCTVVVGKKDNDIDQKAFGGNTILCGKVGTKVQEYARNNGLTYIEYLPVERISLNNIAVSLQWNQNNVVQLVSSVVPSNATIPQVGYKSSNPSVAIVDGEGKVTALSEGTATITAVSLDNSTITATCQVAVTTAVKEMTLSRSSLKLAPGVKNRVQLTVTKTPANTNSFKVLWKSSNTKIATVDENGVVTGKKPGKANITATCNGITVTCEVIIIPDKITRFIMKGQTVSSITLGWKPVSGVTGYALFRYDTKSKNYVRISYIKGSASTYTFKQMNKKKLTPGTSYTLLLRPYKQIGKKKYYGEGLSLKTATKPATVAITSVKKIKKSRNLGWTINWKKVKGASGYQIYLSTNGGKKYRKIATIKKPAQKSYQYSKGKKGRFYIKIRAYKNVGNKEIEGAFSKIMYIRIY